MEAKSFAIKQSFREKAFREAMVEEDIDYETEEDEVGGGGGRGDLNENEKKKKGVSVPGRGRSSGGGSSSSGGVTPQSCQAHNCGADLSEAKRYHRRHKVCEFHSKAAVAMVAGIRQRFCQQCSRFHELSEFDEAKRSCRRRLAGHNERRRKSSGECQGESTGRKGSTPQSKENHCRVQMTPPGSSGYKHLHIR